jgi:hypothetical protein
MSASQAIRKVPKPVLFALYGALGGLAGALFLGEPAWALLKPPPPPVPQPTLAVTVSASVQVYAGQSNTFFVQSALGLPPGTTAKPEVKVRFEGAPAGVRIPEVSLGQGRDGSAEASVAVSEGVPPGVYTIRAVANGSLPGFPPFESGDTLALRVDAPPMPMVDVVFALDTSGSMQYAIDGVRDGITRFASGLRAQRLDFRVGLVDFCHPNTPPTTKVLRFGESPFTNDVEEFRTAVGRLRERGGGPDEASLEGITVAADQPWREKATRVVILITDEPPYLRNDAPQFRAAKFAHVREAAAELARHNLDQIHLVIYPEHQGLFTPLQEAGQGQVFNLRRIAAKQDTFEDLLPRLGTAIADSAKAARPDQRPQAEEPKKPAVAQSLQSKQQFAEGSGVQLLAFSAIWSAIVAASICVVLLAGQHHYLRSSLPGVLALLAGLGGGLAAGTLGGLVGQGFYSLGTGGLVGTIFQVVGWMLLGGLAGAGLSFFIPNLKWYLGGAGGVLGGFIGVLAFLLASQVHEAVGRLVGACILGGCIGAMVALVEAAFRKVWLEVKLGPRETITVNLGPEPVKIGADAKNCTVWARGAAPVALRYFVRNGQVVCHDVPSNTETIVKPGDTRGVGPLELTVKAGQGDAHKVRAKEEPAPAKPVAAAVPPPAPPVAVPPPPVPVAKPAAKPSAIDALFDPFPSAAPPKPKPAAPAPPTIAKPPAPTMPKPPVPSTPAAASPPPPPVAAKCPECGEPIQGKPGMRICRSCGAMS